MVKGGQLETTEKVWEWLSIRKLGNTGSNIVQTNTENIAGIRITKCFYVYMEENTTT